MTLEELTQQLWKAGDERWVCRITLEGEPLPRTVHPYGICTTSANRIVLVCWQSMGFTKAGGKEGYRNLQLERIVEFEILDTHFQKRSDFNSTDGQYKDWVFHL
jgi:predicted DNA-binding transcriptional regulator YafY